ncbi:MAG: type II toxin-antitoxin system HicB family antitoxin [Chloroflexi bacterium]|nr:type II toxin-antitoxin system HicB family antitoxin [Chloroflexota bacterium]
MSVVVHRYRVVFEAEENGWYSVHCPALKGVHSQGSTYEQALANIREAIEGWLDVERESGDAPPNKSIVGKEEHG